MRIALISDNVDTIVGMRLVGIEGTLAHERDELNPAIEAAVQDPEVGIILVTEKLSNDFPDIIDGFKLKHSSPLLIIIPDRHGTGRKKDFITSFVSEAIGLKL